MGIIHSIYIHSE